MIEFEPIGIIHTPFPEPKGIPIQPAGGVGVKATIEVFPQYRDGLADLDGFSHVVLLYHFHRCSGYDLSVVPYLDTQQRGLFATRAPRRPNPIGLSVVQLVRTDGCNLDVSGVDMLDGTPLLDLKPYVPEFDRVPDVRLGWLSEVAKESEQKSADDRFHKS